MPVWCPPACACSPFRILGREQRQSYLCNTVLALRFYFECWKSVLEPCILLALLSILNSTYSNRSLKNTIIFFWFLKEFLAFQIYTLKYWCVQLCLLGFVSKPLMLGYRGNNPGLELNWVTRVHYNMFFSIVNKIL